MIRVDLGRDEAEKKSAKKNPLANIKLPPQVEALVKKLGSDVSQLVRIGVALAVAIIPYILVNEYMKLVREKHLARMKVTEAKEKEADAEMKKLLPFKKELESFEAQKATVNERLRTIRSLLGGRSMPVTVLDAVGQALPKRVWLSTISFSADAEDKAKLSLNGQALSNEDISDFIDKLKDSIHFEEVTLQRVVPAAMGEVQVRGFDLSLSARPTLAVNTDRPVAGR